MVIRLLTALSGPDGSWAAGDLYPCDDATALRMIAAGYGVPAEIAGLPLVVETAEALPAPEQAVRKGRRR